MREVIVSLGERSYPIRIGSGVLPSLGAALREWVEPGERPTAAVVTDSHVAPHYLAPVRESLESGGWSVLEIRFPAGEQHKNLAWLAQIYDRLIDARLDRGSPVIALGGGVVGDLAGFAAATYLRGVPYVQVPTTLLAQVDASVGGKTAVNHAEGKNLIGAFHQPRAVWIDLDTLRTLPSREYLAGLSEVVKYGAICDGEFFERLESMVKPLRARKAVALEEVVARSCEIKASVVAEDERESGLRAILNFGHTVGHAIESLTAYERYLHGEAVAIGMVAATRASHRLGLAPEACERRIADLLSKLGLPTAIPPDLTREQVALAMETDKKARGGKIRFVALEDIGRTRFERRAAEEIAALAWPS